MLEYLHCVTNLMLKFHPYLDRCQLLAASKIKFRSDFLIEQELLGINSSFYCFQPLCFCRR